MLVIVKVSANRIQESRGFLSYHELHGYQTKLLSLSSKKILPGKGGR